MDNYESPGDFWKSYGVSYQMLHEKTQKLRNILNDRLTDQTLLTEEEGDYIVKWFNDYMVEKSQSGNFHKKDSTLDELFPDKSEIIKMLDKKGIGVKQEEEEERIIDMSDINPFLAIKGGKRRKTSVPKRYVPKQLSKKDKKKQGRELKKSRQAYKKGKYHTRKKMKSFKSKVSPHIIKARKMYKIDKIKPTRKLAKATKCKLKGLKRMFKKGQGAYFSSGSRPNQTGHSWGYARMASAITGGKASAVDFKIIQENCSKKSRAYKLAKKAYKKYKKGRRRVKQVTIGGRKKNKKRRRTKKKRKY